MCAFSCKRKYELRKHMQLKHSQDGAYQPPVFQCKYCAYHTQYRQALLNHENCKHTRQRQFCCALCTYCTYSSTSLFLHKRKVHGYVPGDQAWLERYAQRERENGSAAASRGFCPAQALPAGSDGGSAEGGGERPGGEAHQPTGVSRTAGERDCVSEVVGFRPAARREKDGVPDKQDSSVTAKQESPVTGMQADGQSATEEEECCTLVLAPVISGECADVSVGDAHLEWPLGDATPLPGQRAEPAVPPQSAGEDEASMADCEEHSDGEGGVSPRGARGVAGGGGRAPGAAEGPPGPEAVLKALKRRDREQAEALVLEGRVQMLVVQTKARVFRCERCSYVSRSQASLRRHRRSACWAGRTPPRCHDCDAQFKQQRGLDTHRRTKCPVLLKKGRRFPCPTTGLSGGCDPTAGGGDPTPGQTRTEPQVAATAQNKQSGSGGHGNQTSEPADTPPEPGREEEMPSCCTEARPSSLECEESAPPGRKDRERVTTADPSHSLDPMEPDSALDVSVLEGVLRYRDEGGRFKCNNCSFSSCRLATIERHCTACAVKNLKRKASRNSEQNKPIDFVETEEDDDGDEDYGGEEEGEEDADEMAEDSKPAARLACPSCPFTCHQKRALDRHRARGCLRPGDVQCPRCSFVARSQGALQRHARVHGGRKPAAARQGSKARLQCELCPFTCKQARCLAQHLALKHQGAKPHACRYCGFSTTRRYRLEAHESLHTGVGRHPCPLCPQTFGTTSKLRLHRQRVHERRPTHFCSACDYSGYSLNDVSRHTLSCHTGELCHACALCQARFSSDTALKQHCLRLHQEPVTLACPSCPFTCRSQATLKAHALRQHPQLDCPTCRASFPTRQALEEHRRTHLAQRCPSCPFAAREKQALAQHLLDEHEDGPPEARPLQCAVCEFRCRHQLVLEQHVRSHGGARLYKCTDCQYSTRNRQKITWHTRIHTGEKPYRCQQCSYACADPSRLKVGHAPIDRRPAISTRACTLTSLNSTLKPKIKTITILKTQFYDSCYIWFLCCMLILVI